MVMSIDTCCLPSGNWPRTCTVSSTFISFSDARRMSSGARSTKAGSTVGSVVGSPPPVSPSPLPSPTTAAAAIPPPTASTAASTPPATSLVPGRRRVGTGDAAGASRSPPGGAVGTRAAGRGRTWVVGGGEDDEDDEDGEDEGGAEGRVAVRPGGGTAGRG